MKNKNTEAEADQAIEGAKRKAEAFNHTPLTDQAEALPIGFWSCATVTSEFARKLERERNALLAERDRLRVALESVVKICEYNCPEESSPAIALAQAALAEGGQK